MGCNCWFYPRIPQKTQEPEISKAPELGCSMKFKVINRWRCAYGILLTFRVKDKGLSVRSKGPNEREIFKRSFTTEGAKDGVFMVREKRGHIRRLHTKFPDERSERLHICDCFADILYSNCF